MNHRIIIAIVFVIIGFSCSKKSEKDALCFTELTIVSTQTPTTVTLGNDIVAKATCTGPNLCYSFSYVDIKAIAERIYEIRTKGKVPCKASICLDAIYQAQPSFNIKATLSGQYILRYYNSNTLFKADTVTAN
jgi:hypothetical protein